MKVFNQNLIKRCIVLLPLFSSSLLFGDGGASVPCEYTSEYKAQTATLTAQHFTLIEYSVNGENIPLSSSQKVRYNNNTDWVNMSDITYFDAYYSTVDEENTRITGIKILNSTGNIYLDFESE